MSADIHAAHHDAHHGHGDDSVGHGSLKGYLIGFGLSVILTFIPFWLVMGHVFDNTTVTGILVMLIAVAQIFVHMVYFLHMNTKAEGGWNMLALIFTIVMLVIVISGSLWVMYHLNVNMMPQMAPAAP
ncbi:MAG: cytochrome o ubiquinol oxidase subunit IV [Pararhizobium sp.]